MESGRDLRRKSPRVIKPLPILIFWSGKSGRHTADMYDVGTGGCFLNTAGEAEAEELVSVEIPNPGGDPEVVSFQAQVVPQKRKLKGFGLRFLELGPEQCAVVTLLMRRTERGKDRER